MNRDIIKELSKWLEHYKAYVDNHITCDVFMTYDNTENAAEELYIKYIKPYQNQKAIECLMGLRYFIVNLLIGNYDRTMEIICEQIDYDIKELEEKDENN